MGNSLEPSPSPAPVVSWLLPFTPNSLSAAGQLPGEPGPSQGVASLAPTGNLSLREFLSVFSTWELKGTFFWKLVHGFSFRACVPASAAASKASMASVCLLILSLWAPHPSSFSVYLPLFWTISYPRFEIIEI